MRRDRHSWIAFLIAALCTLASASDARQSFDQLKALEGKWAGKGSEGQEVKVSFRMTAGGSALMNEILGKGPENMVTMIHMDGDRLRLRTIAGPATSRG